MVTCRFPRDDLGTSLISNIVVICKLKYWKSQRLAVKRTVNFHRSLFFAPWFSPCNDRSSPPHRLQLFCCSSPLFSLPPQLHCFFSNWTGPFPSPRSPIFTKLQWNQSSQNSSEHNVVETLPLSVKFELNGQQINKLLRRTSKQSDCIKPHFLRTQS